MGWADELGSWIDPAQVRSLLRSSPAYTVNRDRAGALLHDAFATADAYERARPTLFAGGLAVAALGGWMAWRRRARGGEAMVLWSLIAALGAGTAYLTRPSSPTARAAAAQDGGSALAWLDRRVAVLRARNPAFADQAIARLVAHPSVQPYYAAAPSLVRAVIS